MTMPMTTTCDPPGATYVGDWPDDTRFFEGVRRGTKVEVYVGGMQRRDGTIAEAFVFMHGKGRAGLTAATVRELICDLQATVDELERLELDTD
jgi:hypothetical protein